MRLTFDRLPPERKCIAPEGHSLVDVKTFGSAIPRSALCSTCGQFGHVVVMQDAEDSLDND